MEKKQSIYKLQDDIFKGAFDVSIFSTDASKDFITIDGIGKAMQSKSITWINEASGLMDNFFSELFMIKGEEMVTTLINAYFYIQRELAKQSNLVHPKLKEFLECMFSLTANYTKLMFSEKDYVMGYIKGFSGSFAEFLGSSVYKYTMNEGFPTTLLLEIRGDIPDEIYKGMMRTFYMQLMDSLRNVSWSLR
eukprot:TRINITY_DN4892_c0_g1_i6.p1 TRINITY_DN4892_c0_g1~~TRINITY_DN4892_c0_g1_i6.p1  ORF type:complete len:192 (-),score=64.84 TRINITY_DN4892_c0_g1_i6:1079-1654(-)